MSCLKRSHAAILPLARATPIALLFFSSLLLAACNVQWHIGGAPPVATVPPLATVTQMPITRTPAAETETPIGTPTGAPPISTPPSAPTQTEAVTPTDPTPTGAPTPTVTPTPTRPAGLVVNGDGNSNAGRAHLLLQSEADPGNPVYLIIVSGQSTGVEGEIYRDLRQRGFRTTTGPDEGIDTSSEFCYPDCVFVLGDQVNAIGVNSYMRVLQHEYRHIVQVKNNPNMAQDFRDPGGMFTPYGAFSEACADYGLNVAPIYRAQQRIGQLKNVLGADRQGLIDQACAGDKSAYQDLVDQYNQKVGRATAFQELFPRYR
jgi:hypothetical protein